MNIARNTAEWVLTDSPPRPPPGLGGSRVIYQQVYQAPPPVYQASTPVYQAPSESSMSISAQEWVPVPPPIVRRTTLDVSMDDAIRNLKHAFACAEHAKKIAHDAAIVAQDATNAAQIAKATAMSASESVEKAANILKELYQVALPVHTGVVASGAGGGVSAAPAPAPLAAPVLTQTTSSDVPTSPILSRGKVRHGAKFCFRKQKGLECKLHNGKCKWCK